MTLPNDGRIPFFKGLWIVVLFFFAKKKFQKIEDKDNKDRINVRNRNEEDEDRRSEILWKGYVISLTYILLSLLIGTITAFALISAGLTPGKYTSVIFQLISALFILWATLSVGGWSIQSYSNDTLTEKVGRWVASWSYSVGTLLLVVSLLWE